MPSSEVLSSTHDITSIAQLVEPPHIPPHRSHDPTNNLKRSDPFQFGSRYLERGDDVFEFNAWDHVEPDEEYKTYAEIQYAKQRESPASDFDKHRFNANPVKWWNLFYKNNTDNFFKDRKWLRQEFPVLAEVTRKDAGKKVVLEVGAGAGNTAFPLLLNSENDQLMIHACDFSHTAVKVMRESEHYDPQHISADVWDVAALGDCSLPPGLTEGSVDVVILIFIFSALSPSQWEQAIRNLYRVLKPGGRVLFRDYGHGDLAQVRFKRGRYLAENFYVRGDGTLVYFFGKEELQHIWGDWTPENGIAQQQPARETTTAEKEEQEEEAGDHRSLSIISQTVSNASHGPFKILNLGVDRRLIVNRQKKLKMYRCWLQLHMIKDDSGTDR